MMMPLSVFLYIRPVNYKYFEQQVVFGNPNVAEGFLCCQGFLMLLVFFYSFISSILWEEGIWPLTQKGLNTTGPGV